MSNGGCKKCRCEEGRVPRRCVLAGSPKPVLLIALILMLSGGRNTLGATQVLIEGFEGVFPGSWAVGDANGAGTAAYWGKVDSAFGGEGTHSGSWKGYCAGTGFAGTTASPSYQNNMQSFMQRSIDLTPYTSAQLAFWQKVPSIETSFDYCRVLVDGTVIWTNNAVVSGWTQVTLSLNAFVGGVHTLRFEFVSDGTVTFEGWYLDDIEVTGFLAPPNDNFADAQTLVGTSGNLSSVNTDATKEAGEPNHAGNIGGASVWYQWTATQNGVVTFNTFGSSIDTLLAAYTGTSVSSLFTLGSNDDYQPPANRASSVTFQAAAGRTYRVAVDGYNGASGGFQLHWQFVTVNETILAVNITNYSAIVIDSDASNPNPGYDRDAIRVKSEVRSVNSSPVDHFTTYALRYRILGPGDVPHPIFDSTGVTNSNYTFNFTNVLAIPSSGTITNTNVVAIRPAARLDPYVQYRLELQIYRYGNFTGQSFIDTGKGYYHFTNLVSGDLALNVIAQETLTAWNRIYAVKTVPGKQQFLVDASYALLRYDNFSSPVASASAPITLNYQLIDTSDSSVIPLVQSQASFTEIMPSCAIPASGPNAPAIQFFTHTIPIQPANGVQLDAVNKQYRVAVTVSHTDQGGQPPVTGNTLTSADQRLLHFNGHLFFGGIDTVFTSIANDPPINGITASFVRSALAINNNSGSVVGSPNHVYGDGTALNVALRSNGNAELTSGSVNLSLNPPGLDTNEVANVRFLLGPVTLTPTGGTADVGVFLPSGFGYATDTSQKYLNGYGVFPAVPLTGALIPAVDPVFTSPVWICEETKPFWMEVNSVTWQVNQGQFVMTPTSATKYVRQDELDALAAAPVPADQKIKRSNEGYFRSVFRVLSPQVIVAAGADGGARMWVDVSFSSGQFRAHLPYAALIAWQTSGEMNITNDLVDVAASQLTGVVRTEAAFNRDCFLPQCGAPLAGPRTNNLNVGGTLGFTLDGGLAGSGTLSFPAPVEFGYNKVKGKFAHMTDPFTNSSFLMPGVFLRGDLMPPALKPAGSPFADMTNGPGVILLTGFDPTNHSLAQRPKTPEYSDPLSGGSADYAGFNFRLPGGVTFHGESVLGGQPSGPYELTNRSKYYARWGGISGIHQAVPGTFSPQLTIYGYNLDFSNFGLSFLDSQNQDSTTQGYVDLPKPAFIHQNFEELKFNCVGDLTDAKVPANEAGKYKLLDYWNADFVTLGIKFDRSPNAECSGGTGFLVLGVKAHATHVDQPLYGFLGFHTNGNLVTLADTDFGKPPDLVSRLKLPNTFKLAGPNGADYAVTPVTEAYFNNHDFYQPPGASGFLNFAAKMDVPFFEDVQVHMQTGGKTNDAPAAGSIPVFLMGGWPAHGWTANSGQHFFSHTGFDPDNIGFPVSNGGFDQSTSLDEYRNYSTEDFHPRAQQRWLDVVDFDYPLAWSDLARSFRSFKPIVNFSLLVLTADHELKYLDAKNAELVFGAQYKGLPQFNLANMFFKSVDDNTGSAGAFEDAGLGTQHAAIVSGLGALDALLDDQPKTLFKPILDQLLDARVTALYVALSNDFNATTKTWTTDPNMIIHDYFVGGGAVSLQNSFKGRFDSMVNSLTAPMLPTQLKSSLDSVSNSVSNLRALFGGTGGDRPEAVDLATALVKEQAQQFLGSFTKSKFEAFLADSAGTLDNMLAGFDDYSNAVFQLRGGLEGSGDWLKELKGLVNGAALDAFLQPAENDVKNLVGGLNLQADNPFKHIAQSSLEGMIRQKIQDRFFTSQLMAGLQTSFRQRLYDFNSGFRQAADTSFAQLNQIMRDTLNESLAALDNQVFSLLGKLKSYAGAGKINGYAHINDDSLKELRLDAEAHFKVPAEMSGKMYFLFKEYDSDGSDAHCAPGHEKFAEVSLGADDVELNWITSGLKATVGTKFTFVGKQPVNVAGKFHIKGDGWHVDPFTIPEVAAIFSMGDQEAYFGGKVPGIKFRQYKGSGGIFFGHVACDLDPLKEIDADVFSNLGNAPFTGAYGYGEVWIPISEAILHIPCSCAFCVSGGMGGGVFYFTEGPTYGGVIKQGISGEILCLVDVEGTVKMVGVKNPDGLNLQGKGTVSGEIGHDPFSVTISRSVTMSYKNGDWKVSY